jgi:hypothetical protein
MSTSSSLPPSTRHIGRGGASHLRNSHTFHQRCVRRLWRRRLWGCQVRACRCSTVRRWPATGRWTSGRRSTTVEVGRTVTPPSSTTVRDVETSRVATLRETSTCMHQRVRARLHMHLSPGSPGVSRGGGAWRWPHTCEWWSGHPSSGPTCQKSMMGWSIPPSSCRSTPPPSSRLGGMRLSWPTTSP